VLNAVPRNARTICEEVRRRKLQKLMRACDERDALMQEFSLAHRISSPISSSCEIFPPGHVDLFFTRMSFFS